MIRTSRRRLSAGSLIAAAALVCSAGIASATTEPPDRADGHRADDVGADGRRPDRRRLCRRPDRRRRQRRRDGRRSRGHGRQQQPVAVDARGGRRSAAGLVDTLNSGGPFTVFAPINTAFAKIDPATLEGVLADTDALTGILTYHVVPEQLSGADLVAGGTFATVNGAELTVADVGGTIVVNGGAAAVLCGDVPTANATVFLIDSVLMPPA